MVGVVERLQNKTEYLAILELVLRNGAADRDYRQDELQV